MSNPKLILYSKEIATRICYGQIFNHEFEVVTSETEEEFLRNVREFNADVGVLCYCFAQEKDVEELVRLEALAGPLPVLACSQNYNPNFIRLAAQRGVDHFLLCSMEARKIRELIFAAIRGSGLRKFLESCCPGSLSTSPYVGKMLDIIAHNFPHRLSTRELSERLGITSRRFHMICQEAFGKSFTHLMRRILVYQALNMMKSTKLDNTDIAFQLNYRDESSLARILKKELGYNATEARKRLTKLSPEELLA